MAVDATRGVDASILHRLSPLLDEAMDMDTTQQAQWLQQLPPEHADLLPLLRRMLGEAPDPQWLAPGAAVDVLGTIPAEADYQSGSLVGPYTLVSLLGQGGMGDVWLAQRSDGVLRRKVALKLPVLGLRKSVLVQRLERERDILATLNHPHIARLYDAGMSADGQPYLALEYVQGVGITEYANRHGLDARARIALLGQVLDAVQYAHANLVIHRDLKPANVLVDDNGQVRLLDFGIAKLLQEGQPQAHKTELTQLGGRALTVHYAAPEQWLGLPVSTSTDVWALGVLLYELLTDKLPFEADSRSALERVILERDARRPSLQRSVCMRSLSRELATDLDTIVLKAMHKEPAQRYATVNAMADDLQRWARGEPVQARPDSLWYRMRKFVIRHRWKVLAGALAVSALAVTAAVATVMSWRAQEQSHRAVAARDFLIDMFRRTDPDLSRGRDITARELLAQGHQTILQTLAHQPLLQAELLLGVGDAQSSMEDYAAADQAYARAADLLRQLERPREAAQAYLDRAFLASDAMEDSVQANRWLAQARAVQGDEQADPAFAARALVIEMILAFLRGDSPAQEALIRRVQPLAQRAFAGTTARQVQALRNLAEGEGQIGQYDAAIDRMSDLMQRLQAQPTTPPALILGVQDDLAELEFNAGRYRAAMLRYEDAHARCQTQMNPGGSQCDFTQYGRARVLLYLGMVEQALQTVPNLLTPGKGWQSTKLVRAYHVLDVAGRLADYPQVQKAVHAIGEDTYPEVIPAKTRFNALLAQARHFLRLQQAPMAQRFIEQAQAHLQAAGLDVWYLRASLLYTQGMLAQLNGQFGMALELLRRSTELEVQMVGARHPAAPLSALHQVRVLWAAGQTEQAKALLDQCLPPLEQAMGAQAPSIERLRALRREIEHPPIDPRSARTVELFY